MWVQKISIPTPKRVTGNSRGHKRQHFQRKVYEGEGVGQWVNQEENRVRGMAMEGPFIFPNAN